MSTEGIDLLRDNPRTYGRTASRTPPEPSLFLDFARATALDPRITFTRGSQATLFDSTGTLVYAKHNLALQSENFSTTWATTNATVASNTETAPDGTATADTLTDDATNDRHLVGQGITTSLNTNYTVSCFLKAGTLNYAALSILNNATSNRYATIVVDLSGGTITDTENSSGTTASSSIVSFGNGWYRVVLTAQQSTTAFNSVRVCLSDSGTPSYTSFGQPTYSGSGSTIILWGAQLNLANMEGGVTSSLTTYYPTTTAAYYAPRFDYNPSTLQPLGLLIEEARTNSFPASNDFANATYWTVFGTAVVTAGAATGPDGLTSASNLAGATDTTLSGNNIEESVSISASTAYTFSVFVKSNGGTEVALRLRDSTGGSTTSPLLTVTSSWTRISVSRTMAVGATSVRCLIGNTNGDIFIYGAQLEAGAFATSYIPTTTTALTRNADVATMTGTNFSSWCNASEGTVFVSGQFTESVALKTIYEINDNTTSNHLRATVNAGVTTPIFQVSAGTAQAAITLGSAALNVFSMTNAYKVDDFSAALNGTLGTPDTSGSLPTVTQLTIGRRIADRYLNGYIQRIAFYPQRLPNTTLQALTV